MQVEAYEIKEDNINTVGDMIRALMDLPENYALTPGGEKCALAVNHYEKCVHLDNPSWIDSYKYVVGMTLSEEGKSFDMEVPEDQLEKFHMYYVWEQKSETDGEYSYYSSEGAAISAYKAIKGEKTIGMAHFEDGKLTPYQVIITTI